MAYAPNKIVNSLNKVFKNEVLCFISSRKHVPDITKHKAVLNFIGVYSGKTLVKAPIFKNHPAAAIALVTIIKTPVDTNKIKNRLEF